jgi:hypothetical protein
MGPFTYHGHILLPTAPFPVQRSGPAPRLG